MINMKEILSPNFSNITDNVNKLFTLPTIGLPTAFSAGSPDFMEAFTAIKNALAPLGLYRGIPIFASSQKEVGENSIGKQIMLRSSELGTQIVTDNVAPVPRTWIVEGYIGATNKSLANAIFGRLTPVTKISVEVYLQAIKDYLRYLRVLRAPFQFITKEGDVNDVLMSNYHFEDEPTSMYATKLHLELVEYVALSVDSSGSYYIKNTPGLGTAYGMSAKYASSVGRNITSSIARML